MQVFHSPYEHAERGQRHLGSMLPRPSSFNSRGLITTEPRSGVKIITCLRCRIHVARHVALMTWNWFLLRWRRPEAEPTTFGGRMKEHGGHPRVLILENGELPGGWLRPDDCLWRFLGLWLDGREVVGDERAVRRMTLLLLINALLLHRKFLFLNFLGEYSSKFAERLLENWAFLMRPKNYICLLNTGLKIVFFWGEIDID